MKIKPGQIVLTNEGKEFLKVANGRWFDLQENRGFNNASEYEGIVFSVNGSSSSEIHIKFKNVPVGEYFSLHDKVFLKLDGLLALSDSGEMRRFVNDQVIDYKVNAKFHYKEESNG